MLVKAAEAIRTYERAFFLATSFKDYQKQALQLIKGQKCEAVIYCGDFCAPFTAKIISSINLPIYACFGNNDEDQYAIAQRLNAKQLWPLAEEFAEIEPELGQTLEKFHWISESE